MNEVKNNKMDEQIFLNEQLNKTNFPHKSHKNIIKTNVFFLLLFF